MANYTQNIDEKTLEFIKKFLGTANLQTTFPALQSFYTSISFYNSDGNFHIVSPNTSKEEISTASGGSINYAKALAILAYDRSPINPYFTAQGLSDPNFDAAYDAAESLLSAYIQDHGIEGIANLPSRVVANQKNYIERTVKHINEAKRDEIKNSYDAKKSDLENTRLKLSSMQQRISILTNKSLTYEEEQELASLRAQVQQTKQEIKTARKELKTEKSKVDSANSKADAKQVSKSLKSTFSQHEKQAKKEEKITLREKFKAWKTNTKEKIEDKILNHQLDSQDIKAPTQENIDKYNKEQAEAQAKAEAEEKARLEAEEKAKAEAKEAEEKGKVNKKDALAEEKKKIKEQAKKKNKDEDKPVVLEEGAKIIDLNSFRESQAQNNTTETSPETIPQSQEQPNETNPLTIVDQKRIELDEAKALVAQKESELEQAIVLAQTQTGLEISKPVVDKPEANIGGDQTDQAQ